MYFVKHWYTQAHKHTLVRTFQHNPKCPTQTLAPNCNLNLTCPHFAGENCILVVSVLYVQGQVRERSGGKYRKENFCVTGNQYDFFFFLNGTTCVSTFIFLLIPLHIGANSMVLFDLWAEPSRHYPLCAPLRGQHKCSIFSTYWILIQFSALTARTILIKTKKKKQWGKTYWSSYCMCIWGKVQMKEKVFLKKQCTPSCGEWIGLCTLLCVYCEGQFINQF